MKRNASMIVIGTLAGLGSAGVASAGLPAWCKGPMEGGHYELQQMVLDEPGDAVPAIAKASCTPGGDVESHRREVDAMRAKWQKTLGMNDADWADEVAAIGAHDSDKIDYSSKNLAQMTPIDQFNAMLHGFDHVGSDPLYVADALGDKLTETGRLGFLKWCAKNDSVARENGNMVKWAVCQEDLDKFDVAKLGSELRSDTAHTPGNRAFVRVILGQTLNELKEAGATKAKLIKQDDEWAKLFKVAADSRADWQKQLGGNTKLLELVQLTDSGTFFHSRKMLDGCEAKTAEALATAIAAIPAKAFTGMHDDREDPFKGFATKAAPMLMNVPAINVAAIAYSECQPATATGDLLAEFIQWMPGWRGPRSAAIGAIAGATFKFDDTKAEKLQFPSFGDRPYGRSGGAIGSAGGVVKSTKLTKDLLEVTLEKTTMTSEDCVKEHKGRPARIRDSGSIEYEMICDKTAMVTHDTTWSNFTVNPAYQKLLKPGVKFSAVYGSKSSDVIAIWPNKTAKLPSWVLGGTVK